MQKIIWTSLADKTLRPTPLTIIWTTVTPMLKFQYGSRLDYAQVIHFKCGNCHGVLKVTILVSILVKVLETQAAEIGVVMCTVLSPGLQEFRQ